METIYSIKNIDCVQALEEGSMMVFLKDGTKIETTDFDVSEDGTIEFGYIFN